MSTRLIERVVRSLSKPDATLFVAAESKSYFVGEAIVVAAAILAVQQFFSGFLKELGIESLGAETARRMKALLAQLVDGHPDPADINAEEIFLNEVKVVALRQTPDNRKLGTVAGEGAIIEFLMDRGATNAQAKNLARRVATSVLDDAGYE